jgi:hypothetical protein
MRLVAIGMETFQQGSCLLVGRLEVVNRDERWATELCSSSASCVKAETWSTRPHLLWDAMVGRVCAHWSDSVFKFEVNVSYD